MLTLSRARRRLFLGFMMAACLIASVPIAIIYNFFVDRFVAGFTVGAMK
jgi:multiple sugar transport system permease protein